MELTFIARLPDRDAFEYYHQILSSTSKNNNKSHQKRLFKREE